MPIATVQIVEERDPERKRRLMAAVAQAIATSLDARLDTVRVIVHEVPSELWSVGGVTKAEERASGATSATRSAS